MRDHAVHEVVFFEIFSSKDAHKFPLEQAYTKKLFAGLDGKLASASRRDPTESAVGALSSWGR
jgi:quinol monooxygenase YgiN